MSRDLDHVVGAGCAVNAWRLCDFLVSTAIGVVPSEGGAPVALRLARALGHALGPFVAFAPNAAGLLRTADRGGLLARDHRQITVRQRERRYARK